MHLISISLHSMDCAISISIDTIYGIRVRVRVDFIL